MNDATVLYMIGGVIGLVWLVWFTLSLSSLVKTNKAILETLESNGRREPQPTPGRLERAGIVLREG